MTSLDLKFACGFYGKGTGITGNPNLSTGLLNRVARCVVSGANQQLYVATLTIPASGTTTLNLVTGLTNPAGEAVVLAHCKAVFIEHDAASLSTGGITSFGGGSNDFQGVWSASDKATLLPGRWTAFGMPATDTGITVDATHKNVALVNLDAVNAATVNVFVLGTTT